MAGAAASTGADSGAVYRLPRVEYFATGNHDGEEWTKADLDEMADNFRRFKGKLDPPLVVGHEDDQRLLDATDLPAAGWPDDLRVEWDPEDKEWKLVGPAEGVPPEVADWINRGLYRKVSSEIYDDSGEAGLPPGHGRMLRRVALLGGELPKVKILRRLPRAERSQALPFAETGGRTALRFSEARRPGKGLRRITFFSERRTMQGSPEAMWAQVDDAGEKNKDGSYDRSRMKGDWHISMSEGNMDRNQLAQAALQMGIPQSAIDKLSDEELAQVAQAKQPAPPPPVSGGNFAERGAMDQPPEDDVPPATYAEDDLGPDPVPNPQDDPANPRPAGSYGERCAGVPPGARNYSEEAPRGDLPSASPADVPKPPKDDLDLRTNGQVAKIYSECRKMYAEMQSLFKTYRRDVSDRRKVEAEAVRRRHARSVKEFCESRLKSKKLLPHEADPKNPHGVYARMLRTSPRRVHQFSEGGRKVQKSEYQLQCEEIDRRDPAHLVRFFSEKMPQGGAGPGGQISPERRAQLLGATPYGQVVAKKLGVGQSK